MNQLKKFFLSLLSRRIMLWVVQKFIFVYVFAAITDQYMLVACYLINCAFDLFILNELNVKPIDAKIEINK